MRRYALLAVAALCCPATAALAQDAPASPELPAPEDLGHRNSLTIGVGAGLTPDYEGSDDYRIIPAAAIRGQYHGIAFSTRGTYLYVDLIPRGSGMLDFDAGPIAGVRLSTRRHIHDDIVELLPRRKRAIEVGGFAGVSLHGLTNPYDSLGFHVDVTHDISSAHKSTIVSPAVDFSTPLSRTTYVSANVGMEFVSNRFADYYFSISPSDSVATGGVLPVYDADGGLKNWKAGLLLNQSLSGDLLHGLSLFGLGQYSRLVHDFKRSPIVSERGSPNQWLGAVGFAYSW